MAEHKQSPHFRKNMSDSNEEEESVKLVNNFEFPAWMKGARNLPGLCSSNVDESSMNDSNNDAEVITSGLCSQVPVDIVPQAPMCNAQAPMCNADSVNDIAGGKWSLIEPYALARPFESCDKANRKRERLKERSNYAKALLLSEKELEKLAQKIRAEIHQSEMFEVAVEAERAANAGFESFYARPSTFGTDTEISGRKYLPSKRKSSRRSSARILPEEIGKIRLFDLRNASEVIPPWKKLHAHVRTHLHREKVDEHSLAFQELGRRESKAHLDVRGSPSNTAVESVDFIDGMEKPNNQTTESLCQSVVIGSTKQSGDWAPVSLRRLSNNTHEEGISLSSSCRHLYLENHLEDAGFREEKNPENHISSPSMRDGIESSSMVNCFESQDMCSGQLGLMNEAGRALSWPIDHEVLQTSSDDSLCMKRAKPEGFRELDSDGHIRDTICHSFQLSEDNFSVVVQEMMSRLSPIPSNQLLAEYVDRKENEVFLKEHFYCKVVESKSFDLGPASLRETICIAPCNGYHRGCHVFDFEGVYNGLEFIFSKEKKE